MTDMGSFRGSGVALLTPFEDDGALDLESFRSSAEHQIESGTDYLVPCGSTGEAGTLTAEEQRILIKATVEVSDGRVPVLAGAGALATADAVRLARAAADEQADAILAGSPPYSRPPQEGLFAHFRAIADAVDVPVIVYNVPGRTAVNVLPETVLGLAGIDNVWGVKEASGNLVQISTIIRDRPDDFLVIAGDDELTLPIVALGGDGAVSVIANQVPRLYGRMVHLALDGKLEEAREIHFRLVDLMRANFVETNPVPAKAGMALLGRMSDRVRLPLVSASPEARKAVERALESIRNDE
ncbi:MAG: 4-hydroxy-tetrahydrodipicolinate synthase [Gemmatimonadota bacterium]